MSLVFPPAGVIPPAYPVTIDPMYPIRTDVTGLTEVDIAVAQGETTGLILLIGDSVMANRGGTLYAPSSTKIHNINISDGKCYRAVEPLIGNGGSLGSFSVRMGQMLIDAEWRERVILMSVCIPATLQGHFASRTGRVAPDADPEDLPVQEQAGIYNHLIGTAIKLARKTGQAVDAVVVGLGTNDAYYNVSQALFESDFRTIRDTIRGHGVTAPIIVPKITTNFDTGNATIRAALTAVVDGVGVLTGPDTDPPAYLDTDRRDGTHFSDAGNIKFATQLAAQIGGL